MSGFIYFIRCNDFVKVGFSASPEARLRDLQIGCPYELSLAGAHPGSEQDEGRLKRYLSAHLHRAEWFWWCPMIESIARHGIPHPELPPTNTAADLMALWPTVAQFARDIGVKPSHAQVMKVRNSIPAPYWPAVAEAAKRRNFDGISVETLLRMFAGSRELALQAQAVAA